MSPLEWLQSLDPHEHPAWIASWLLLFILGITTVIVNVASLIGVI